MSTTDGMEFTNIEAFAKEKSGVKEMEVNGENSIVSFAVSAQNNWVYVNAINKSVYLKNLRISEYTALIGV